MTIIRYQTLQSSETPFTTHFSLTKKTPLHLGLELKKCQSSKHFPPFDTSIILYFNGVVGMNAEYIALCRVCACEIKMYDFDSALSEGLHHLTNPRHQEKHYNAYFQNLTLPRKSTNISIFSLGCPDVLTPEKYRLVRSYYGSRMLAPYIAALYHISSNHYIAPKPSQEIPLTMIAPMIHAYNVKPRQQQQPSSQSNIPSNPTSPHKTLSAAQNAGGVSAKTIPTCVNNIFTIAVL